MADDGTGGEAPDDADSDDAGNDPGPTGDGPDDVGNDPDDTGTSTDPDAGNDADTDSGNDADADPDSDSDTGGTADDDVFDDDVDRLGPEDVFDDDGTLKDTTDADDAADGSADSSDADGNDGSEGSDDDVAAPAADWTTDHQGEAPDDRATADAPADRATADPATHYSADESDDGTADHGSDAVSAAETEATAPVSDGGAYDVDDVDPYSGPGTPANTPGAPDDEEMPLGEHVEEMIRRLGVVIVVAALVSGVVFPFADRLINFLWYSFLPGTVEMCPPPTGVLAENYDRAACPWVYHPLALMFARLKVASLVGLVIAMPVLVYESYLFMKPGLYPRERRYYLASVPTSLILAGVGVGFAYLLVLPTLFAYFTGYTSQAATVAFGLTETFNLIVMMMGFFALVFQIPLLIMLAVMMGVTTRRWLASRRLYFYGGFATVAFLFSPDPTGMAPILVAVTMIVLFEGTLLVLRWTRESSPMPSSAELAAQRPAFWLLGLAAGYLASSAPVPDGYYDSLPAVVVDVLADLGLTRATPLVIGVGLIALYEFVAYVLREGGASARVRRTLARGRAVAYPVALVVGYFGSPDPTLVARVEALALDPLRAGLVVVGFIVLYELLLVVLDWRERRSA